LPLPKCYRQFGSPKVKVPSPMLFSPPIWQLPFPAFVSNLSETPLRVSDLDLRPKHAALALFSLNTLPTPFFTCTKENEAPSRSTLRDFWWENFYYFSCVFVVLGGDRRRFTFPFPSYLPRRRCHINRLSFYVVIPPPSPL